MRKAKEIGDIDFPLEIDPSEVIRDHKDVGKRVVVTPYANEVLRDIRGKKGQILGVIIKNGQIAGYEISCEAKKYLAPKKDFFVEKQYVEDVYLDSAKAQHVKQVLSHWKNQHDYYGPSWDGIELFCFELAKATDYVSVESSGWYDYNSSSRRGRDGKDWRYVIPDDRSFVCVNCHSLLHDHVWTLATTIFSSREIFDDKLKLKMVGHPDHWMRVYLWVRETILALTSNVYLYEKPLAEIGVRIRATLALNNFSGKILPSIVDAYEKVIGRRPDLADMSIGFSKVRLNPGTIGRHEPPTDEANYSIISVSPLATESRSYLRAVITHELIHYVLRSADHLDSPHDDEFHAIADIVGLKPEHRD